MKKRDSMSREIRESMKEVIREKGFGYWFKEVFWYHYGKLSIGLLVALIVAVVITVEGMGQTRYDFNMVLALEGQVAYAFAEELLDTVENAVGDLDGNGEVNVNLQIIDLADMANLESSQQRLQLMFAQEEYALYIMDDRYSSIYCQREYFEPAADYGFEPDETFDRRVDIDDAPVIARLNSYMSTDPHFYGSICDWTVDGGGKKEWTDAAVRALKAIIEAE